MSNEVVQHTDRVGSIRYKLVLGKYPVKRVTKTAFGFDFAIQLPGGQLMVVTAPPTADIREGDLITLYTEVLSAQPSQSPQQ